ncbi:A2-A3 protein [Vibrio phage VCPH]|nr:A2-A3 protein [Vibrio phage VCPH]
MTTKAKAFAWNKENEATITSAYEEMLAQDHAKANSKEFLAELAKQVGAKSAQAVRSKLSNLKVYEALEAGSTAKGRKARITKPLLADCVKKAVVDAGVEIRGDAMDTLANANTDALTAVLETLETLTGNSYMPVIEEAQAPKGVTAKA